MQSVFIYLTTIHDLLIIIHKLWYQLNLIPV